MQRPAADIFVVGFFQAFPTFYLILALYLYQSAVQSRDTYITDHEVASRPAGLVVASSSYKRLAMGAVWACPLILFYPVLIKAGFRLACVYAEI
jgi:hypothetical protein